MRWLLPSCAVLMTISSSPRSVSGVQPDGRNDFAAEQLWNKCIRAMRTIRGFEAEFTQDVGPKNSTHAQGKVRLTRSGEIYCSYMTTVSGEKVTSIMKSDGKQGTLVGSNDSDVVRYSHKDFMHFFGNAIPGFQEFFLRDG